MAVPGLLPDPAPTAELAPPLTVVGIGADGWAGLSAPSQAAIAKAEVIIGSPRHLALLPAAQPGHAGGLANPVPGARLPLPSPLLPALDELIAAHAGTALVVLASGDPMFYGIGATLVRRLGAARVAVLPHPSSVSLAAARLGWPLEDAEVISAVGRPLELVSGALQPGRRLLVLAAETTAAAQLRALLAARGFGASPVTVLADLGAASEQVFPAADSGPDSGPNTGSAAGAAAGHSRPHSRLAILAVECVADATATPLPRTPGLPDDAYEQDGQITKREIRAIALAALAPLPGQLLWDVGAGSGSIGIEWMRAHPASRAIAIEPRAERRERIAANAAALGTPGLRIVPGSAPDALAGLPVPDAVFLGGGLSTAGVVSACWQALAPGGRLVANAVTLESEQVLIGAQRELGGTLTRIAVERAAPLGAFTTWRPALPVVQWAVRKAGRP